MAVLAGLLVAYKLLWQRGAEPLVVYCAHDSVYSEKILREFERQTGIPVQPVFDTESTKSLGLVERLIREKDAPRCDVFWNNELLGTLDLKERGLLLPYKGSGYARIPDKFRDPDGCWTGFAARFRVWIVNTASIAVPTRPAFEGSGGALAKPIYGTTLTHYTVLWHHWGADKLKAWHKDWRERGNVEARGNAHVRDLVADGTCHVGLTDTDDFFVARDAGKPVALKPFRLDTGATICIPNTVCIIQGTRRLEQAQKLVDYLLSERCERALADSAARQVPLGPIDPQHPLRPEVATLAAWVKDGYPLGGLGPARAECLAWLKSEYAQ